MLPLSDGSGLHLRGEMLGTHRGPLALTDEAARTDEIVLDLTDVRTVPVRFRGHCLTQESMDTIYVGASLRELLTLGRHRAASDET
ncbi:hypothetical protein [Streptomyces sp. NPDC055189]